MQQVVLITGASSGIGKETARLFARNKYKVIATARNIERMKDLEALGCNIVSMDVTSEESIQAAFQKIFQITHSIDILVNNAGYSQNGFVEELTMQHLRHQFEVNVFGLIRVTQMVLPVMRQARKGLVINVGSVGGEFTTAGASAYHASKYALESFTDGLRQEINPFGIQVVLIKPGGVETNFINNSLSDYPEPIANNPYQKMRDNFQKMLTTILDAKNSSFPILSPVEVAEAIFKSVSKPKTRVRIGRTAKIIPFMKKMLSDKAFDKMIVNQLGIMK
jgi:short-subunit dehydrogenase